MSTAHVFVQHPQDSKDTCWICGAKKGEHSYLVQHKDRKSPFTKTRKKKKVLS